MKTKWDYTELAQAYLKRPDYSDHAIDTLLERTGLPAGSRVCDVGAGVAHLTLMLLDREMDVVAVEPNDAMRALGMGRTEGLSGVRWEEGTGEETRQAPAHFHLVTFGSSFNVTDRGAALAETARILRPGGWFAAMWNHRDLADPIQREIEGIISRNIPDYDYGTRREDQGAVIRSSGLFRGVERIEGEVRHTVPVADVVEAWRSHATLQRQAGERFGPIVEEIEGVLAGADAIEVPYTTRIWMARLAHRG